MASLRTIYERAVEAIQQAMTAAVNEPRTVLALAKELRALLRQMADVASEPVQKDERMAALARRRHAKVDAAAHAEPMREACGSACETDATAHAADDAASVVVPSYSGTEVRTSENAEESQKEEVTADAVLVLDATTPRPADPVRTRALFDAPPHAETDARKRAAVVRRPDDVPQQVWDDWCALRRRKRATVSETGVASMRAEAGKAGMQLAEAMTVQVANGWQGFRADWVAKAAAGTGGGFDRSGRWTGVPRVQSLDDYRGTRPCDENGVPIL
ncbi:MAG: hypothetical protein RJA36_2972 [Pseudomonadota bacterium]|jgi:hypothetical protein